MGLDLLKGIIRNNLEAGVIEPAMSKVKIIQVHRCFDDVSFYMAVFLFIVNQNVYNYYVGVTIYF